MKKPIVWLAAAGLALVIGQTGAVAASPGSGTISFKAPTISWSGSLVGTSPNFSRIVCSRCKV